MAVAFSYHPPAPGQTWKGPWMDSQVLATPSGVVVTRTAESFDPAELERIAAAADRRRGGVLSSGMEYPGRYSRWHLAYIDPPLEITASSRTIKATALNDRGRLILPVVAAALARAGEILPSRAGDASPRSAPPGAADSVTVHIPEGTGTFTEEERSRRPTVFTALREVAAAFRCEDPHLGLYGAFGYDLAFQFEPVRQRLARDPGQRDLVVHLPDEIWALDRQREEAIRYRYEFQVGDTSTAGLPRETPEVDEDPAYGASPEL